MATVLRVLSFNGGADLASPLGRFSGFRGCWAACFRCSSPAIFDRISRTSFAMTARGKLIQNLVFCARRALVVNAPELAHARRDPSGFVPPNRVMSDRLGSLEAPHR